MTHQLNHVQFVTDTTGDKMQWVQLLSHPK